MCCCSHALPSAADGYSLGQSILSGIFESVVDWAVSFWDKYRWNHIWMGQIHIGGTWTEVETADHESEQKEFKSRLESSSTSLQPVSLVLEHLEGQDQLYVFMPHLDAQYSLRSTSMDNFYEIQPTFFLILDYCSLFWLWGCSTWGILRSNIKIISQRIHWSVDPRSSMFSHNPAQNPLEKFSSRIFNALSFIKSNDSYSDLYLDYSPVSCHIKYCRLKFPFWNLFGPLEKATLSFSALRTYYLSLGVSSA